MTSQILKIKSAITLHTISALLLALVLVTLGSQSVLAAPQPTGQVDEFDIPTQGVDITGTGVYSSGPSSIAQGPDGNLWFVEQSSNKIGRITPAGVITEFDIPTGNSSPTGIIAGPDGNLWFTEQGADKIGRITPSGAITEFSIPTPSSYLAGITTGPDGNLWFAEQSANKIGRITPSGIITEFDVPTSNSNPTGIVAGPDGNLWFTGQSSNKIGRITPAGVITEFDIPTPGSYPSGITSGLDGNLWFTSVYANKIGRVTPSGIVTEFAIPTPNAFPTGITAGPDGNIWFTEGYVNKIGSITPAGIITEITLPSGVDLSVFGLGITSGPSGITAGPDGNLWFTEGYSNKIGVLRFADDEQEDVIPTVNVNGNKPIDKTPVIPKRPVFTGTATPGAHIVVTVHSDPVTCSTTVDGSGNWSCTLPSNLEPGMHTVYIVITNPDSSIQNLGPYSVLVTGRGGTAVDNNTPLAPDAGVRREAQGELAAYAVVVGIGIVLILAAYSKYRQTRHGGWMKDSSL